MREPTIKENLVEILQVFREIPTNILNGGIDSSRFISKLPMIIHAEFEDAYDNLPKKKDMAEIKDMFLNVNYRYSIQTGFDNFCNDCDELRIPEALKSMASVPYILFRDVVLNGADSLRQAEEDIIRRNK